MSAKPPSNMDPQSLESIRSMAQVLWSIGDESPGHRISEAERESLFLAAELISGLVDRVADLQRQLAGRV